LVTFSALIGYLLSDGFDLVTAGLLMGGVFLLSAGSSTLNQYQERGLDARMSRTRNRPIPSGLITPTAALMTALGLLFSGATLLYLTSTAAFLLGLINIALYNGLYTPLKTKTLFSIIPGALVGAVPPLMGWSAAGGWLLHPHILFVALFMFLWQIPHFWLLISMYGKEYEEAGFSTISQHFSHAQVKHIVFVWAIFTSLFLLFFPLFQLHFPLSFVAILVLTNALFITLFYRFLFRRPENLFSAFITINSFMTVILVLLVVARFVN
jgi:protoheme IX farnesyltransferase